MSLNIVLLHVEIISNHHDSLHFIFMPVYARVIQLVYVSSYPLFNEIYPTFSKAGRLLVWRRFQNLLTICHNTRVA